MYWMDFENLNVALNDRSGLWYRENDNSLLATDAAIEF